MSRKEEKFRVLECLKAGMVEHEARQTIDEKNLLATGGISKARVAQLLARASGKEHSQSPHHLDKHTMVNIVKTKGWYVKWYYIEPNTVFISVHNN
jgi:hypothetical protein